MGNNEIVCFLCSFLYKNKNTTYEEKFYSTKLSLDRLLYLLNVFPSSVTRKMESFLYYKRLLPTHERE